MFLYSLFSNTLFYHYMTLQVAAPLVYTVSHGLAPYLICTCTVPRNSLNSLLLLEALNTFYRQCINVFVLCLAKMRYSISYFWLVIFMCLPVIVSLLSIPPCDMSRFLLSSPPLHTKNITKWSSTFREIIALIEHPWSSCWLLWCRDVPGLLQEVGKHVTSY